MCFVQVYNAYQTLLKGLASMLQIFHGIAKGSDDTGSIPEMASIVSDDRGGGGSSIGGGASSLGGDTDDTNVTLSCYEKKKKNQKVAKEFFLSWCSGCMCMMMKFFHFPRLFFFGFLSRKSKPISNSHCLFPMQLH